MKRKKAKKYHLQFLISIVRGYASFCLSLSIEDKLTIKLLRPVLDTINFS